MPRLPEDQQFWMVVRLADKGSAPRVRHATYDAAKAEARRLANKLGEPFVVLWASSVQSPKGEA